MMETDLCAHCTRPVTDDQHAILCDVCQLWQHRTCKTGISLAVYLEAVEFDYDIPFVCKRCIQLPATNPVPTTPPMPNSPARSRSPLRPPPRERRPPPRERRPPPKERRQPPKERRQPPRELSPPPRELSPPPRELSPPPRELSPPPREHSPLLSPPRELSPPPRELSPPPRELSPPPRELSPPPRPLNPLPDQPPRPPSPLPIFDDDDLPPPPSPLSISSTDLNYSDFDLPPPPPPLSMDIDDFNPPTRDVPLDASFDLPDRSISINQEPSETTFHANDTLPTQVPDDVEITYRIIEKGSKRGGRLLLSSDGYSYGVKAVNKSSTRWFCSVRSKSIRCRATVSQVGDAFFPGASGHSHPGDPKLLLRVELQKQVREKATNDLFRPAMRFVEDAVLDVAPDQRSLLPKQTNLKRVANRFRSKARPTEPSTLDFTLDLDFINSPEFLIGDLRTEDGHRHLIFSSPFQRRILRQSRRWFMDGTFKAVTGPFKQRGQLFSINAFVKGECGELKQFPLMFALMSRKTKDDYIQIFRHIQALVGPPDVEGFVADFEKALWQALRDVHPGIPIKGCVFHFNQAIWRRTQELGLSTAYRDNSATRTYIRQLMALPFLPPRHIPPAFDNLSTRASSTSLQSLVDYMRRQWISNPVFPVDSWSVYQLTVRTNNDIEGMYLLFLFIYFNCMYSDFQHRSISNILFISITFTCIHVLILYSFSGWHTRLNQKSGGAPGVYRLIQLLKVEAELMEASIAAGDMYRETNRHYRRLDEKLKEAWTNYMSSDLSTGGFLRTVGNLYGFVAA
ncbi:hypothetical protein FSP39_022105 [Pinctada imbricata]|uniref:MULE transposase domain-containing protein n=1 Tax=Pinctada imbricata TaxID=66713 RepID=A0AA89BJM8_PINIB|nr:hypothetical protein FSP39_022105 [Pinctada imbricata]